MSRNTYRWRVLTRFWHQEAQISDIAYDAKMQCLHIVLHDLTVIVLDLGGTVLEQHDELKIARRMYPPEQSCLSWPTISVANGLIHVCDPVTKKVFGYNRLGKDDAFLLYESDVTPLNVATNNGSDVLIGYDSKIESFQTIQTPFQLQHNQTIYCHGSVSFLFAEGYRFGCCDTKSASAYVFSDNGEDARVIDYWPRNVLRLGEAQLGYSYRWGIDCDAFSRKIWILHGAGGALAPSHWIVDVNDRSVIECTTSLIGEPTRIALISDDLACCILRDEERKCSLIATLEPEAERQAKMVDRVKC